jgi:hypothetical protein
MHFVCQCARSACGALVRILQSASATAARSAPNGTPAVLPTSAGSVSSKLVTPPRSSSRSPMFQLNDRSKML